LLNVFLVFVMAVVVVMPCGLIADTNTNQPQESQNVKFKQEELAQILAPVALYPDPLLAQVLMASTYPLEVVEAARWLKDNSSLKDSALDSALKDKNWEVSVKSLVHFPDVLQMMNDKIEWTEKMGNAFLAQKDDVMDTVQTLRAKSKDAGNLKTTKEQTVVVKEKIIEIQPADPAVVYVPMYDPLVVYGSWWYPAYPPYPVYYPGYSPGAAAAVGFASGLVVGAAVSSWAGWNWNNHDVHVDVNKTVNFNNANVNRNVNVHNNTQTWQHDSSRNFNQTRSGEQNLRSGDTARQYQKTESAARQYPRADSDMASRRDSFDQNRGSRENASRSFQSRGSSFNGRMQGHRR
jgi:hypothetical protein